MDSERDLFAWLGHSGIILNIDGLRIAVDPVFSITASPFNWVGPKSFDFQYPYSAESLPEIDVLLLTHDHYDHLDFQTVRQLERFVSQIIVPLGVAPHLTRWGIPHDKITELDWWEEKAISSSVTLTSVPSRHFAGRGIRNRNGSLWCAFALKGSKSNIYLGGDSGYGDHFKLIGEKLGPFDLAFLECGQYNENWPWIHMMPEQTVQASIDINARHFVPLHWGKYSLSLHPWTEPPERASAEAFRRSVSMVIPRIGEIMSLVNPPNSNAWWRLP